MNNSDHHNFPRRQTHASIDSQNNSPPERNSIDMFCRVSQEEEWKDRKKEKSEKKKDKKNQLEKIMEWFHSKWIYIKSHWRASLVIGSLFVILLSLFIAAVLLLTLLPKKKDSIESNNFTPGIESTTSATEIPESPHGYGRIKSMSMQSYQFKNNLSENIDSIIIDGRRGDDFLLIFVDTQIISLNIEKQEIIQKHLTLECDNCKVYDALPQCFNNNTECSSKSIFYCCEDCSKKGPMCSNFGIHNAFHPTNIVQDGSVFHNSNSTVYQMEIIQNVENNCQIHMETYVANLNGGNPQTANGESLKCSDNPNNFFIQQNLIAASARNNETTIIWRANIDLKGTLQLYFNETQKYYIYDFVNTSLAEKTLLKMKYDKIDDSFFISAFAGETFSLAKISTNETTKNEDIKVLHPLPFKLDFTLGSLADWTIYNGDLFIWYLDFDVIYSVKVLFEWD